MARDHVADREFFFLLGQPGQKNNLQQQIAQFFLDFFILAAVNGFNQFMGFFQDIFLQGLLGSARDPRDSRAAGGEVFS